MFIKIDKIYSIW